MRLTEAIALGTLGVGLGFGGGYLKGKHSGETDRMQLAAQVEIANGNIDACALSLEELREQNEAEVAKADKHAEATKRALEDVVRENLVLADQLADVERRMALAASDPTCAEQMEAELCAAVPLL